MDDFHLQKSSSKRFRHSWNTQMMIIDQLRFSENKFLSLRLFCLIHRSHGNCSAVNPSWCERFDVILYREFEIFDIDLIR